MKGNVMKKLIAPLALVAAACFGLYACLTSDNSATGTTHLAWEWDRPVTKLDQTKHVIATKLVTYECSTSGVAVADTDLDTNNYTITGGKLYLWSTGECGAEAYSGTSTTIIGTWNLDAFTKVAIPTSVRPIGCTATPPTTDTSGLGEIGNVFQNDSASAVVSTTKVHLKLSGDLCFGQVLAEAYGEEPSLEVVSNDCQSVHIKAAGTTQTATVSSGFSNNGINITFKYWSKSCTLTTPFPQPGTTPNCTVNSSNTESAFENCVNASGFGAMAAKTSVVQSPARSSALVGAIRKLRRR